VNSNPASLITFPRSGFPFSPGAPTKNVEMSEGKRGRVQSLVVNTRERIGERGEVGRTIKVGQIELDGDVVQPGSEPFRVPLRVDGDLKVERKEGKRVWLSFETRRGEREKLTLNTTWPRATSRRNREDPGKRWEDSQGRISQY